MKKKKVVNPTKKTANRKDAEKAIIDAIQKTQVKVTDAQREILQFTLEERKAGLGANMFWHDVISFLESDLVANGNNVADDVFTITVKGEKNHLNSGTDRNDYEIKADFKKGVITIKENK